MNLFGRSSDQPDPGDVTGSARRRRHQRHRDAAVPPAPVAPAEADGIDTGADAPGATGRRGRTGAARAAAAATCARGCESLGMAVIVFGFVVHPARLVRRRAQPVPLRGDPLPDLGWSARGGAGHRRRHPSCAPPGACARSRRTAATRWPSSARSTGSSASCAASTRPRRAEEGGARPVRRHPRAASAPRRRRPLAVARPARLGVRLAADRRTRPRWPRARSGTAATPARARGRHRRPGSRGRARRRLRLGHDRRDDGATTTSTTTAEHDVGAKPRRRARRSTTTTAPAPRPARPGGGGRAGSGGPRGHRAPPRDRHRPPRRAERPPRPARRRSGRLRRQRQPDARPAATAAPPPPGVTANTITVGNIASISGVAPGLTQSAQQATEAWAAYVNSNGGICGRQIKVQPFDDGNDSGTNYADAQQACSSDFAMVGNASGFDDGSAQAVSACSIPDMAAEVSTAAAGSTADIFGASPGNAHYWPLGPANYLKAHLPQRHPEGGDDLPQRLGHRRPRPRTRWRRTRASASTTL